MSRKNCLECKHSYIEDLYNEICCDIDKDYIGDMHIYERAKKCEHYEREQREIKPLLNKPTKGDKNDEQEN